MSRLGLNVIGFNEYADLPDMLDKLFNNSEKVIFYMNQTFGVFFTQTRNA